MNSDYKNASSFRYLFTNTEYSDLPSLTRALAACWDEGKNELFTGALAEYFTSIDKDLAKIALQAADAYRAAPQDADWIFLDFLFRADDTFDVIYCKEKPYPNSKALGREILQALDSGDYSECRYLGGILRTSILKKHKKRLLREARSAKAEAILEQAGNPASVDKRTHILNAYLLGYYLAEEISFRVDGRTVKTISQLTQYMKSLLDVSYETLEKFCHTLIDYNDVLDVRLEAFLLALGKREELTAWKNSLK